MKRVFGNIDHSFNIILLSLFSFVFQDTHAQSWLWAKGIGGVGTTACISIAIDPGSGDVYSTGYFQGEIDFDPGAGTFHLTSVGEYNIFISKLDATGNFVWAKAMENVYDGDTLYGAGYGLSISVDPDGDGGIYTTGYFSGVVDFDPGDETYNLTAPICWLEGVGEYATQAMFISKLDASGNFEWAQAFTDSWPLYCSNWYGSAIAVSDSGSEDVFIMGFHGNYNALFISKLDSTGNVVWTSWLGGIDGSINGVSIAIDSSSGDVFVTGSFGGTVDFDPAEGIPFEITAQGYRDIFICRLASTGGLIWAKAFGGAEYEFNEGFSISVDNDHNVYSTGYFQGTTDFDPGDDIYNLMAGGYFDAYISKLDGSGNFVWAKQIGGAGEDEGFSIAVDRGTGDVYCTGYFEGTADFDPGDGVFNLTANGFVDAFISKLDASGDFAGASAMGGANSDQGRSIVLDQNSDLHIGGAFSSPSISFGSTTLINENGTDAFIAKLGPCPGIVTSASDTGNGSLRDIITCSSVGANITFDVALIDQTITLTSGEILINKDLTLSGPGILDLTISGNNTSRIFNLLSGKNLILQDLSLKNATAVTHGGAIYVNGNLTLENVVLENNFENGIPKGLTLGSPGDLTIIGNVDIKD